MSDYPPPPPPPSAGDDEHRSQPTPPPPPSYGAPQLPGDQAMGNAQANSGLVSIPGLGTVKVATIGQRALARIVDAVVIGVVYAIIAALGFGALFGGTDVDPVTGEVTGTSGFGVAAFFGAYALIGIIGIAYEVVMIAVKGQTVGKMVMGVKVVQQANGQVAGWGPSFIRYIIPVLASAVTCGLGGLLVYLSPLFDKSGRMQGWHDNAANDLVISTK